MKPLSVVIRDIYPHAVHGATVGVAGAGSHLRRRLRRASIHADGVRAVHTIGYVLSERFWGLYLRCPTARQECPQGFNDGPREQFKILLPG